MFDSPYIQHMRPRSWPIVALHFSSGVILAWLTEDRVTPMAALLGALAWAVCLNGGTLALNSAFDRDSGDIGYLDDPPPIPAGLGPFGVIVMLAGLALASGVNKAFFWLYAFNGLLSVLYSVPPFRFKVRAGADVCINAVGYGLSTFLAGWLAQAGSANWFALLVGMGFAFLFAGFYPLTQIYQYREDREGGAVTLTVALGVKNALVFSAVFIHLAFAAFLVGFWTAGRPAVPVLLLGGVWLIWVRHLRGWSSRRTPARQKAGMYEALSIWALTDCMVLLSALG
ncbi:MAG: hypothetical protein Kow0059_03470 [Candidatus Sumerlaeia bacterium]